jgi:hypothetical protein
MEIAKQNSIGFKHVSLAAKDKLHFGNPWRP